MKTKTEESRSKIKTAGYSSATLHAKRDARRRDAAARNAVWSALSPDEKLKIIYQRRGNSTREVTRIQARNEKAKAKSNQGSRRSNSR